MNIATTQNASDSLESTPSDESLQVVLLKAPDGFKSSTEVGNAATVPPVKPPRIAFPFEEIR